MHQIEQELLNEELQLGKQQAELAAKKYTSLYDFAPSGYFTLTMDGKILELNLAGARMLGKERLHLQNSSFGFFVSDQSKPVFNRFLTETFNGAANALCEVTLTANSNIPIVVSLSGARDESGKHCLVSAVDITERKQGEEKLKESKILFQQVFELSNVGKSITRPSGEINVNQAICNMLGYSSDELKNKKWQDITPPDEVPDTQKILNALLEGKKNDARFQKNYIHKNGTRIWTDVSVALLRDQMGKPLHFITTIVDISEQKRVEMALKESENHSRSIIEAIPDLMFVLSSEGVYQDFKADISDLAYQKESIIGKKNRDMMPPDFADLMDEKIKTTLKSGSTQQFEYQLELPQKGICYFEARMVPCENDRVLAIVRNITERKTSEAKILEINNQLTELNATKDKFFNIIAHDLKSPFNSIVGFSDLLMDMASNNDYSQMGKYAGIIHQSSHRAIDLLMNLMEWARTQTGRIEFNPEIFEMDDLIDDVAKLLSDNAVQKKITISKKLPTRGIAKADKAMISTVLRNLIANAIKFTKPGGEITLSVSENKSGLTVAVKDNGIGIPARLTGKLFRLDESFTTRGTEKEQGTGLGLILCKEFIEKHGCKIWVESEEGTGSTFYFTVPCHAEAGKERLE